VRVGARARAPALVARQRLEHVGGEELGAQHGVEAVRRPLVRVRVGVRVRVWVRVRVGVRIRVRFRVRVRVSVRVRVRVSLTSRPTAAPRMREMGGCHIGACAVMASAFSGHWRSQRVRRSRSVARSVPGARRAASRRAGSSCGSWTRGSGVWWTW